MKRVLKKLFWRPGRIFYTYSRYKPMIDFIVKEYGDAEIRVLDVGCGHFGIAEYLPYTVTGIDLEEVDNQPDNLNYYRGSILALPFQDDAFDIVLSCDVLEHLQPDQRIQGLKEMIRVSRKDVLIACPVGDRAQASDRLIHRWGKRLGVDDKALTEHLTRPYIREYEIDKVLESDGYLFQTFRTENMTCHVLLAMVIVTPILNRVIPVLTRLQPFKGVFKFLIRHINFGSMWRKHYEIEVSES